MCLLVAVGGGGICRAGWPFWTENGVRRGSQEYYDMHAADPPGARQHYKYGKTWPPQPRPSGPHQLFVHKFHHTHYWPYPYSCQDQQSIASFIDVQIRNGWETATTLYDYHFDPETNELNSSGEKHLQWILTHAPLEHRQVHVCVADRPDQTTARTVSVERELAQMAGTEHGNVVVLTRVGDPGGRPGSEVQTIFKAYQEHMPPPILSQDSGSDQSGGM
jgi:hypothetical protein